MKLQAQFLTLVFSRKFSTSWKFYAKLEVLPKRSLVDERLQATIISNLKPHSSGTYINWNYIFKNRSQGWFLHPRNQIFLGCYFPLKIKNLWCCKPPASYTFGWPKNPFSTWNIDTAGIYWKCLKTTFQ